MEYLTRVYGRCLVTFLLPLLLHSSADGVAYDSEKFPFGVSDHLNLGRPEWLVQPDPYYYVVKNRPISIVCRAVPAIRITFRCAGEPDDSFSRRRDQKVTEMLPEPVTGRKPLESSIEVTREEVEEYFGEDGYWCQCQAWNRVQGLSAPQSVTSSKARIEAAYLRRRFQRTPMNIRVSVDTTAQLQCLPPDGKPLPRVFWLKNNMVIDVRKEINYIISSEGSLIISQTSLHHTGNYTCGAVNPASRRLSDSASLTVFLDGAWSVWSGWSDCSVPCGVSQRRRTRSCSSPSAVNGGKPCVGEFVDTVQCFPSCPEYRHHTAELSTTDDVRVPSDEVARGAEYHNVSLYIGLCAAVVVIVIVVIAIIIVLKRKTARSHDSAFDVEISQEAIQCLTEDRTKSTQNGNVVSVQPDVTQIVQALHHPCLHQNTNNNALNVVNYTSTSTNSHHLHSNYDNNSPSVMPPDPPYVQPICNGNHGTSIPSPRDNYYSVPNAHFVSIPKVHANTTNRHLQKRTSENSFSGPPYLQSKSALTPSSLSNDDVTRSRLLAGSFGNFTFDDMGSSVGLCPPSPAPGSHVDSRSLSENLSSHQSIGSLQLPGCLNVDTVAWSTFTCAGGRLVLPASGVTLTVPEGAVRPGHVEEVYMAVCREDKDRPRLTEQQTILSPVILVGPSSTVLTKPVILSFQHCASMGHGNWILSLHRSLSPLDEPAQWTVDSSLPILSSLYTLYEKDRHFLGWRPDTVRERLVVLGQETVTTQLYAQLDPNHCHIMTEQLSRFALIGESVLGAKAVKCYCLAAFAPSLPPSMDYSIRVYVVEDTTDAINGVMQVESRLEGHLLDKPKQILVVDGGNNLCFIIDELSSGWRSKFAANFQEIPFRHIWSGNQNNLHCSFSLEMADSASQSLACQIQVYQKGLLHNRQLIHINTNFNELGTSQSTWACTTPHNMKASTVHTNSNSSSGFSSTIATDHATQVFRLSSRVRNHLCTLLDPPNTRGNDWRMLAQALTVDRYINYFATKTSPTEHIIDLWEARHREQTAVTDLMNVLRVMGRMDAATVLEKDVGAWL